MATCLQPMTCRGASCYHKVLFSLLCCSSQIAKDMERWAKSVNAAKTQQDDSKKTVVATAKPEESKPAATDDFKVVCGLVLVQILPHYSHCKGVTETYSTKWLYALRKYPSIHGRS